MTTPKIDYGFLSQVAALFKLSPEIAKRCAGLPLRDLRAALVRERAALVRELKQIEKQLELPDENPKPTVTRWIM
jgi:hypothetical protein